MAVYALIPARCGSKGIPLKNIVELKGKPLIYYTINAANNSGVFDRIVVSTDCDRIGEVAHHYGAEVLIRPPELAADKSPMDPVIKHFIESYSLKDGDIIVLLQPTSPLRSSKDIQDALSKFQNNSCDLLVSYTDFEHPPQWAFKRDDNYISPVDPSSLFKRRQDLEKLFLPNGAIFIFKVPFTSFHDLYSGKVCGYYMPRERSIDIDGPLDLKIAEALI